MNSINFKRLKSKNDLYLFLKNFENKNKLINKKDFKNYIKNKKPYNIEINDCYQLYKTIYNKKRLSVLEFGSGYSTLVISKALYDLKKKYFDTAKNLRRGKVFELNFIETSNKFKNITLNRIPNFIKKEIKINYIVTSSNMAKINNKICTLYKKLPNCNPDFIYLDGPHIGDTKGNISGINFSKNYDYTPMCGDPIILENILLPGAIIYFDGRINNFLFIKNNLQRKWKITLDKKKDIVILELKDLPLGKLNSKLINFYK